MGIPRKASMMFCNWRRPSRSKRLTLTEIVSTCKLNITTEFIGIDHVQCLYGKGTDSLLWALYKMHMFGLPHSHRDGNFKGSMEVASRKHTHTHTQELSCAAKTGWWTGFLHVVVMAWWRKCWSPSFVHSTWSMLCIGFLIIIVMGRKSQEYSRNLGRAWWWDLGECHTPS